MAGLYFTAVQGGMDMSERLKLTVLKCCFDEELKAAYVDDPDYGLCPYFKPGDVFSTEGERPEGFGCAIGWESIRREVEGMASGESPFKVHILCCNDGIRPVIFKLEREN